MGFQMSSLRWQFWDRGAPLPWLQHVQSRALGCKPAGACVQALMLLRPEDCAGKGQAGQPCGSIYLFFCFLSFFLFSIPSLSDPL